MIGLRNILIHSYSSVDHETLWQIATQYVPELLGLLEPLIPEPPGTEE